MPFKDSRIFNTVLICLLFAVAFGYFQYGYRYFDQGTYHYDEGLVAYGAVRILNGDIPYKDFWTLYAPGVFYVLALIFKIFGITVEVTRLFTIAVLSLTVCSIYLLIKKISTKLIGISAFLLSLAWLKSYMVFNRPGQFAILFFIFCSFPLINFLNSGRNKWLIITGAILGIAGLFRQDFGCYIFISIFLVVLLKQLNRFKEKRWKEKLILIFQNELYLCLGSFAVILPVFIWLIFNSAFKEFINDAIFFPAIIYPKVRALPFPELKSDSLIFYLPLFVFLLTCIRLLFYNWRNKIEDINAWLGLFFLFSGIGLFNYTNTRTCMTHLLPTMVPAIILFSLLFNDFLRVFFNKHRYSYKGCIWIAACFILIFYLTKPSLAVFSKKINFMTKAQIKENALNIGRARGFYDDPEYAYSLNSAVRYIQDKTARNEKIFVGNLRHDQLVNSDLIFYFLCERDSATKYHELHPGLTNMPAIQEQIIGDLIKADVRYIVLWSGSQKIQTYEPNESSRSYGAVALDNFIRRKYKTRERFGRYLILKRI